MGPLKRQGFHTSRHPKSDLRDGAGGRLGVAPPYTQGTQWSGEKKYSMSKSDMPGQEMTSISTPYSVTAGQLSKTWRRHRTVSGNQADPGSNPTLIPHLPCGFLKEII